MVRGLDVFGGFLMDGHLHLMGEIRDPFEESWIFPLGTTTLEGRTFPAPADPDRCSPRCTAPRGGCPDPAFNFAPPATTVRRLNGWFRGLRVGRAKWDRIYSRRQRPLATEPAPFVRLGGRARARRGDVRRPRLRAGLRRAVDGPARGAVGRPGLPAALVPRGRRRGRSRAPSSGPCNLLELRDVLPAGATLSRRPGPRLLMARHLVDTLGPEARAHLWRLARMTLAGEGGGRLYLEFLARFGDDGYARDLHVKRRRPRDDDRRARGGWCDDRPPRDDQGV